MAVSQDVEGGTETGREARSIEDDVARALRRWRSTDRKSLAAFWVLSLFFAVVIYFGTIFVHWEQSNEVSTTWTEGPDISGSDAAVCVFGAGAIVATVSVAIAAASWRPADLTGLVEAQLEHWQQVLVVGSRAACSAAMVVALLSIFDDPILSGLLIFAMLMIGWMSAAIVVRPNRISTEASQHRAEQALTTATERASEARKGLRKCGARSSKRPVVTSVVVILTIWLIAFVFVYACVALKAFNSGGGDYAGGAGTALLMSTISVVLGFLLIGLFVMERSLWWSTSDLWSKMMRLALRVALGLMLLGFVVGMWQTWTVNDLTIDRVWVSFVIIVPIVAGVLLILGYYLSWHISVGIWWVSVLSAESFRKQAEETLEICEEETELARLQEG